MNRDKHGGKMTDGNEKILRVLLLAPVKVTGGITTWARFLKGHSDPNKIVYEILDTSKLYDSFGTPLGFRGAVLGVRDALLRFGRLVAKLFTFRPHVVWFTCSPSIGPAVRDIPMIAMLRLLGIPSIAHLHGGLTEGFFGGPLPLGALRRFGWRPATLFVITREVELAARKLYSEDRVIFVPNMLDDVLWQEEGLREKPIRPVEGTEPFRLIHVAWQSPAKGSYDLIEALAQVKYPVVCEMVGDVSAEIRTEMERRIGELGIGDRVRVVGKRGGEELRQTYRQADLFVFPTHTEGFPMTVLEAMTYGVPIIANDVGNIRDMIAYDTDRPAGLLLQQTAPVDKVELAGLINRLCGDVELRRRFSENGRQRVAGNYLASKIVPELVDLVSDMYLRKTSGNRHRWGKAEAQVPGESGSS